MLIKLQSSANELINTLCQFKNEKDFYYMMRDKKYTDSLQKAAQFIFLNRTSFNGIYRVNLKGEYNVPYGLKKYKQLFDYENLLNLSDLLQKTNLKSRDFEETINDVRKGDLVFLDPPYTVAHENNGFVKYNQKIFSWDDQERLNDYIEKVKSRGAYFILTNAAHESIRDLFHEASDRYEIKRASSVGGKGAKRQQICEYLFTNCLR